MKTLRMGAATAFLLTGLNAGTAKAQDTTFTLVNNTGFTVYAVYIWPVASDYRGPDRLGDETIDSGGSHTFRPEHDECLYNIRVTLRDNGEELRRNHVNLCRLSTLTLHYNYLDRNLWVSKDGPMAVQTRFESFTGR